MTSRALPLARANMLRTRPPGPIATAAVPMNSTPETRTLLVAFHRIGDMTVSTPLFRALARRRSLSLLTRPFGPALLGTQSYVERVYGLPYPNRGRSMLGRIFLGGHRRALGRRLVADGFDEVLIYEHEREVIRAWLEGLFPGRVRMIDRPDGSGRHQSEVCRASAQSAGCDMDAYGEIPELDVDADTRRDARRRMKAMGDRVVGVQTGSQRTHVRRPAGQRPNLKTLDEGQWRALVARLLQEEHADAVIFHGSPREQRLVRRLVEGLPQHLRDRCHDFTEDVGLDLLPAVLAEQAALISVDTGTAHIAAAVRCPLLVVFGPTDPARYAPRSRAPVELLVGEAECQFCHGTPLYKACRDNRCLNRLEDERVWRSWSRLHDRLGELPRTT